MPSVSRATAIRRDVVEREPDAVIVNRPALIQAADMAIYRVEQSGRNGIQTAIAPPES